MARRRESVRSVFVFAFSGSRADGSLKTDRGAGTALNKPPARKPDAIVEEKTLPIQAALYRLSGDVRAFAPSRAARPALTSLLPQYNPLHVDPAFAAVGGFAEPILHGLAFYGISGKHIYKTFGPIKDIKVRFVGSVYPGETLITEMWKEGGKVIFGETLPPKHQRRTPLTTFSPRASPAVTKVKERDSIVLGAAAATLA